MSISNLVGSEPEPPKEEQAVTPLASSETSPSSSTTDESQATASPSSSVETTSSTTDATTPSGDNPLAPSVTSTPGESASATPTITVNPSGPSPKEQADEIDRMLFARMGAIGDKDTLKILIYGDPGCTKSSFLGGAENNLVWEIEKGGLKSMLSSPRPMKPGIQSIPFTSFVQGELLVDRLMSDNEYVASFEVFSVDSITDLNRKMMEQHLKAENAKRPSKSALVPETEDYIHVNEQMTRFIRSIRDLDRDVILTAHAKTVEPKNKPAKTYPDMSESLANRIEGFVDVVAYVEMRKVEDVMKPVYRIVSDGQTHAKNRLGITQEEILDPTWDELKAIHAANLERSRS